MKSICMNLCEQIYLYPQLFKYMHQIKLNRYHCSFKDPFFTKLLMTTCHYLYSVSSILNRCLFYMVF